MKRAVVWRLLLVTVTAAWFATGCSTFNREWENAASLPNQGAQGRWVGTWKSEANGHTDDLRCILRQTGEGKYQAHFYAHYKRGIRFSVGYHVHLEGQESSGVLKFHGDENLHWYAGGIYHYEGTADAANFTSTYSCKYDHGTFQMSRPK
jgi:hypothetical protein